MKNKVLSILGPGLFAIGYTIGTGSVTSMAMAGSRYGLRLLWVLALSCLFSGVLMEAYGRFTAVTGETALFATRHHLAGGKVLAILIFIGVVIGQYTCLGGILSLTSGALVETLGLFFPSLSPEHYGLTLGLAAALIAAMYALLLIGRYSFFEKLLAFFVMVMGLTFLISIFVVWPDAATFRRASLPAWPHDGAELLMLAAFVGTTMAAPTFVTRPLLIKEKGETVADLGTQRLDSIVAASLMFVISGSIMFVATGALYAHGQEIVKILDMGRTLEPLAGRFAVALFMVGTLSAGLSSIFPILMVAPLLISDYRVGHMEPRSRSFRFIALAAAAFGLIVPALGRDPIAITLAAQVSNVFVLPLTVFAIGWLLNRRDLMGEHRAGAWMNLGLALAFVFSCAVAFAGIQALMG